MPNPKWEVYENKATGIEYDLTDADAQGKLTAILDGTDIDSFGDVETALDDYFPRSEQAVMGAVNLLQNKGVDKEQNGLVFTFPGDGTVVVNGTATANTGCSINAATIVKKDWKIVGCPSGGGADTFEIQVYKNVSPYTTYAVDRGDGAIISADDTASVNIVIRNGYHADNLIFKPMITLDLNATYADFVPYAMSNKELTEKAFIDKGEYIGVDIDNFTDAGIYRLNGSITHAPGNYGLIEVIKMPGGNILQLYFGVGSNDMYLRRRYQNVWTNWYKFTSTEVTS